MNSYRNYNNNTKSINKNLEKLSSGYKINRAGDDAAGLAISEKMRAQITGLEGAQKNAKDGISLVQTAEGALTEVHSMLNRMYSLAEQSANGTYDNSVDRKQLQKEVDSLRTEIDRVADSANFNGIKLLDGSLAGAGSSTSTAAVSADSISGVDTHIVKAVKDVRATDTAIAVENSWVDGDKITLDVGLSDGRSLNFTLTAKADSDNNIELIGDDGTSYASIANNSGALPDRAATNVTDAFVKYLKTTSLNEDYKITNNSEVITFTARSAGVVGTVPTSIRIDTHKDSKSSGIINSGTAIDGLTITEGKSDITAFMASDLTIFNGSNAEDAVFTINGQKFAVADSEANAKKLDSDVTFVVANKAKQTNLATQKLNQTTALTADTGLNDMQDLAAAIQQKTGLKVTFNSSVTALDIDASTATQANKAPGVFTLEANTTTSTTSGKGLKLQIGDTADSFNQMNVSIANMHCSSLKIDGVSIESADKAGAAMAKIKDAINSVSDVRGGLGAIQNRLEHTINNLSVMQENIQDAESTIRDTDVAAEMMKYTKNSILVQSAQAMLAQANQQPQGVLQLLQ
jgi:flagellin